MKSSDKMNRGKNITTRNEEKRKYRSKEKDDLNVPITTIGKLTSDSSSPYSPEDKLNISENRVNNVGKKRGSKSTSKENDGFAGYNIRLRNSRGSTFKETETRNRRNGKNMKKNVSTIRGFNSNEEITKSKNKISKNLNERTESTSKVKRYRKKTEEAILESFKNRKRRSSSVHEKGEVVPEVSDKSCKNRNARSSVSKKNNNITRNGLTTRSGSVAAVNSNNNAVEPLLNGKRTSAKRRSTQSSISKCTKQGNLKNDVGVFIPEEAPSLHDGNKLKYANRSNSCKSLNEIRIQKKRRTSTKLKYDTECSEPHAEPTDRNKRLLYDSAIEGDEKKNRKCSIKNVQKAGGRAGRAGRTSSYNRSRRSTRSSPLSETEKSRLTKKTVADLKKESTSVLKETSKRGRKQKRRDSSVAMNNVENDSETAQENAMNIECVVNSENAKDEFKIGDSTQKRRTRRCSFANSDVGNSKSIRKDTRRSNSKNESFSFSADVDTANMNMCNGVNGVSKRYITRYTKRIEAEKDKARNESLKTGGTYDENITKVSSCDSIKGKKNSTVLMNSVQPSLRNVKNTTNKSLDKKTENKWDIEENEKNKRNKRNKRNEMNKKNNEKNPEALNNWNDSDGETEQGEAKEREKKKVAASYAKSEAQSVEPPKSEHYSKQDIKDTNINEKHMDHMGVFDGTDKERRVDENGDLIVYEKEKQQKTDQDQNSFSLNNERVSPKAFMTSDVPNGMITNGHLFPTEDQTNVTNETYEDKENKVVSNTAVSSVNTHNNDIRKMLFGSTNENSQLLYSKEQIQYLLHFRNNAQSYVQKYINSFLSNFDMVSSYLPYAHYYDEHIYEKKENEFFRMLFCAKDLYQYNLEMEMRIMSFLEEFAHLNLKQKLEYIDKLQAFQMANIKTKCAEKTLQMEENLNKKKKTA